jgi:hypothetical protein
MPQTHSVTHKRPHKDTTAKAAARSAAARKTRSNKGEDAQKSAFCTALQSAADYIATQVIPGLDKGMFAATLPAVDKLDAELQPILARYEIGTVVTWLGQQIATEAQGFGEGAPSAGQVGPGPSADSGDVGSCDDASMEALIAQMLGGDASASDALGAGLSDDDDDTDLF